MQNERKKKLKHAQMNIKKMTFGTLFQGVHAIQVVN